MDSSSPLQHLGKYHLIAELGHGGMAHVYLAVHQGPAGFSKLHVLKHLRPNLADNPEVMTMFLDEARLAARLNHPNVVQTYEVEQDGGHCYLAMEYLEGQSFERVLRRARRNEPMPLPLQLRVLCDILSGLQHAHELCDFDGTPLRVVHRDVSPQNIFITYEGQVKVVDFGIAKAATGSAETRAGVLKGKISYMAPEQALGARLDCRADLFAVGILLREALTGQPFWGELSDLQILHQLTHGQLPPFEPEAHPPELARISVRALQFSADDRYSSAQEFREDLERALRSLGAPSSRDLGAYVARMFDDRRAKTRSIIDEQLRRLRSREPMASRPNLLQQTISTSSREPSHTEFPVAGDLHAVPPARSLATLAAIALGAAVLGALGLRAVLHSTTPAAVTPSALPTPQGHRI